jgi:hypothetical protein
MQRDQHAYVGRLADGHGKHCCAGFSFTVADMCWVSPITAVTDLRCSGPMYCWWTSSWTQRSLRKEHCIWAVLESQQVKDFVHEECAIHPRKLYHFQSCTDQTDPSRLWNLKRSATGHVLKFACSATFVDWKPCRSWRSPTSSPFLTGQAMKS